MKNMDKLIEFLNKYYGSNAKTLVFCVGKEAFPSEYHSHLEGWPITCDSFSVIPEYMDGSEICFNYSGKPEIEEWLRDNGFTAEDAAQVLWTNLAVLSRRYNQFVPEPKESDHADYVIIHGRCYKLTLMGGINWQLDAIRKSRLTGAVDSYDFSAIIDPQIFMQMIATNFLLKGLPSLSGNLTSILKNFCQIFEFFSESY